MAQVCGSGISFMAQNNDLSKYVAPDNCQLGYMTVYMQVPIMVPTEYASQHHVQSPAASLMLPKCEASCVPEAAVSQSQSNADDAEVAQNSPCSSSRRRRRRRAMQHKMMDSSLVMQEPGSPTASTVCPGSPTSSRVSGAQSPTASVRTTCSWADVTDEPLDDACAEPVLCNEKVRQHLSDEETISDFGGMDSSSYFSSDVQEYDLSDPLGLMDCADRSAVCVEQLENGDAFRRTALVEWLCPAILELALSHHGCHVVQQALDVASGEERALITNQLKENVMNLLVSPHGNYVLQKCILALPASAVQFVVDELAVHPGGWAALARHRFGCRVTQRLLEHCPESMVADLIDAVVADAPTLCKHPFGNYVVQHVLEFCSEERRNQTASALLCGDIVMLAQHKNSHNVIELALERCCSKSQLAIARAILAVPHGLVDIACSRWGGSVAKKLMDISMDSLREEIVSQVEAGNEKLKSSKQGRSLVQRLKTTQ